MWGGEFPFQSAVANIYNKGPYAFHELRETFGDEKFFQFLKALAQELKGEQIVTRDIQQVAERIYGGSMEWFFDQWLRGVGIPQYALNYTVRKTEDGKYLVEGSVKQRVIFGKEKVELKGTYYRAVAPLTFVAHNGKKFKSKPLLVQGAETPFKMKIADEPAEVHFNFEGEILAHDVLVNRSW
jgi:aminopeptidase N